ncbi:glycine cleavage system protein H [Limosilactobacillus panis]|uniref:glycine cleavage system protein H n=1 Tax=Limosilactobacillus panis TaxID=47493 RepID=UPI001C972B53|nr:glycine cleavage system protein H [Limosilactobacillus panis]QZN93607.1 glycine cleavage system protein H [Limosilactobacillus panis]
MATKNNYFWTKRVADGTTRIGLNDQGRDDLGEVSFIDLPETGTELTEGGKFLSVEAEKAVTDLESPVTGKIVAVNDKLADSPEDLSSDDEQKNWIIDVK